MEEESLVSQFINGVGDAISEVVYDTAGPHGAAELAHLFNTGQGYVPYGHQTPGLETGGGFEDMLQSYSGPEVEPPAMER